jgi:hypothetical protein
MYWNSHFLFCIALTVCLSLGLISCDQESQTVNFIPVPLINPAPIPDEEIPPSDEGILPPGHPPISAQSLTEIEAGSPPNIGNWTVPEHWIEEPPSSQMRQAQWKVPGRPQSDVFAECALFQFSGGGAVDQNLARWEGQFRSPSGGAVTGEREVINLETTTVHTLWLTGTFITRDPPMTGPEVEQPQWALFAAIFDRPESMQFLKCTGPESIMTEDREEMLTVVRSAPVSSN